ncbi:MAG: hypothetical protein R3Y39_06485 [Rikenellaceae bacterium]
MIQRADIEEQHKKIREDRLFALSNLYLTLLNYLVQKALADEEVKELTIGYDLYKSSYNADKSDGTVRVYIYNLRKRLKKYYETTGFNDPIEFVIEKGGYNIKFKERVQPTTPTRVGHRLKYVISTLVVVLAVILVTLSFCRVERYCWSSFLGNDVTTNCIIADQVVVKMQHNSVQIDAIHPDIKSRSEYSTYVKDNVADSLKLANYTIFTKAIPQSVQRLTEWFGQHNRRFNIVAENDFSVENSLVGNIIYIGQFKSMNLSQLFFLQNSQLFGIDNNNFYSIKDGERLEYLPKLPSGERSYEYAMVSYQPFKGEFKALYISSNHDMGTINLVMNFTNEAFLKDFYRNLPSTNSYFNALFKIDGVNRTDISCELVDIEVISD